MPADIVTAFREMLSQAENLVSDVSPFSREEKGEDRSRVEAWRNMFESSCRLAVVGSAKQGKSTLVNALLQHDWSAVGCTETTGTICVMTNKRPLQASRPVHCVSHDGKGTRWVSLAEADAMQGHDREQLARAENVRWLEYALGHLAPPFLADFELVDTPGTGAIIGADGKTHDDISLSFVKDVDALLLVTQDTLGELNKEILKAFQSNRSIDGGAAVFIVCTQADINCQSVAKMRQKKLDKSRAVREEAISNYQFADSTRVFAVSAALENTLRRVGDAGFSALYEKLRSSCRNSDDISDELLEWVESVLGHAAPLDVILDAVFTANSPNELMETLHDLAGVQELNRFITEEMRAKKLVYRMDRLLTVVTNYFQYDYGSRISGYKELLSREQAAYARFCRMMDGDPDFQSGQLGALLKQVRNNFSQQGVEEVENGRLRLVSRLQELSHSMRLLRQREEVFTYYCSHRNRFTSEESEEIEAVCERNGRLFNPSLEYVGQRRNYWRRKADRMIFADMQYFCQIMKKIYERYIIDLSATG